MAALSNIDVRLKLLFLVVYSVTALHARTLLETGPCLAIAFACAFATRLNWRDAIRSLRGLAAILIVTAFAQVLAFQAGEVLVAVGPLAITSGALLEAGRMVVILIALVLVSVSFMRCTSTTDLTSGLARLLEPFRRWGLRVDGPLLALSVTLRFAAVLAGEFEQMRLSQLARGGRLDGSPRQRLAAYSRMFAPLIRRSWRHADTLALSLASRCFGCCEHPAPLHRHRFGLSDAVCLAATFALVALLVASPFAGRLGL